MTSQRNITSPIQTRICKLFAHDASHLSVQRFHAVIAACDGVDCAADFFLQGELRQPESGQIFHTDVPVLIKPEIVFWMIGRQGLWFQIRVWIGEVIFRWLVMGEKFTEKMEDSE